MSGGAWPPPPTPTRKGRGVVWLESRVSPSPGGRGSGVSARPRQHGTAPGLRPVVSAFVGASAGSGKTKLLTDRLLRLMLTGAAPERIQCLTFTKAAAAEMAVRLQKTLGKWVDARRHRAGERTARPRVEPTDASR